MDEHLLEPYKNQYISHESKLIYTVCAEEKEDPSLALDNNGDAFACQSASPREL